MLFLEAGVNLLSARLPCLVRMYILVHSAATRAKTKRELGWVDRTHMLPPSLRKSMLLKWENGYNESFNGKLRDELLNGGIFYNLREAQVLVENWRREYNTIRPHSSLGYRPPAPESIQKLRFDPFWFTYMKENSTRILT